MENANYSDRSVVIWGEGVRRKRWITKGHEITIRVIDMLNILTVVMVSWVYTYVKTNKTVHFNMHFIVYVYTLIKL